jgi:2-polyprenyl-3-methyl-5-hydroxy-6-metoxy-1,4-benzoquinol methylase
MPRSLGAATARLVAMDPLTERIRGHFDQLGDGEWDRLAGSPGGRIAFEVHRRMLAEHVRAGDRVLEVGAGPGRFTIALAELGARVAVTDLSPVQLELNQRKLHEAGLESAVESRTELDARDLSRFGEGSFDVCVAYGGLLSYVFTDAADVFGRLVASVRPGGVVLASVMSTVGSARHFLPTMVAVIDAFGLAHMDHEIATGDLQFTPGTHTCQMYRWREVEALIAAQPCRLLAVSASNCLSLSDPESVQWLERDPERREWFVEWEIRLCREPGAIDAGTHIVFAVERLG